MCYNVVTIFHRDVLRRRRQREKVDLEMEAKAATVKEIVIYRYRILCDRVLDLHGLFYVKEISSRCFWKERRLMLLLENVG